MQEYSIDSPEQSRRRQRLIDQPAHRRAHCWIGPHRFEKFFDPMGIDLHVVIDQQKVVVLARVRSRSCAAGRSSFPRNENI